MVDIISGTINEFLDYALAIVGLLIIYYLGMILFYRDEAKKAKEEADLEERRGKFKEYVDEKIKYSKESKERNRKKDLVSPIRESLVRAIEKGEEIIIHLNDAKLGEIKSSAKAFDDKLKTTWHQLRALRRKLEGAERSEIEPLIGEIEAVQEEVKEAIKNHLPKTVNPTTWKADVKPIRDVVTKARASCGNIFKKVETFYSK